MRPPTGRGRKRYHFLPFIFHIVQIDTHYGLNAASTKEGFYIKGTGKKKSVQFQGLKQWDINVNISAIYYNEA